LIFSQNNFHRNQTVKSASRRWSAPQCCAPLPFEGLPLRRCWGRSRPSLNHISSTAGVEAGPVVLHNHPRHRVLEGLVQLAEAPDDEIDEVVDIGIGFLFVIDGPDLFLGLVLLDPEESVDGVVHDLGNLLRDKLFLDRAIFTSPSSI